MNTSLSSAQLKSISKGQLLGKYGISIGANVAADAIMAAALLLCIIFTDQTTIAGLVITWLITFLLAVLFGIFDVGLTRFYLNLVCGRPCLVSDVFYGFRSHADKAIAIRFFLLAMRYLFLAPFYVCYFLYGGKVHTAAMLLASSIALVIGCSAYIYIGLIYSQTYYILLDFPGYSVKQIMSTSRRIMKGHKGRLFYISVTLIPYYLLGFLSCAVAMLWVVPFQRTVMTNFYLDLMHRDYTV